MPTQGVLNIGEAWGTRGKTAILEGFVVIGSEICMGGQASEYPKSGISFSIPLCFSCSLANINGKKRLALHGAFTERNSAP